MPGFGVLTTSDGGPLAGAVSVGQADTFLPGAGITPRLGPGDLVLLSQEGRLQDGIRALAGSPWIAVALALDAETLLECTSRPTCPDLRTGTVRTGAQTVRLGDRLATFVGAVAIRRLFPALTGNGLVALHRFAEGTLGSPFDDGVHNSRRALRRAHAIPVPGQFLCGGYAAAALQEAGVMERPPVGPVHSNVLPWDLAGDGIEPPYAGGYAHAGIDVLREFRT